MNESNGSVLSIDELPNYMKQRKMGMNNSSDWMLPPQLLSTQQQPQQRFMTPPTLPAQQRSLQTMINMDNASDTLKNFFDGTRTIKEILTLIGAGGLIFVLLRFVLQVSFMTAAIIAVVVVLGLLIFKSNNKSSNVKNEIANNVNLLNHLNNKKAY